MTPATPNPRFGRIPDEYSSPYDRQLHDPKWNGTVSVLHEHRLFRRLPEFARWTKDQHVHAALESLDAHVRTERLYHDAIRDAEAVYGDGNGRLISGIYRDHFPAGTKDSLRMLASQTWQLSARSLAHWQAAGRRVETWRRLRDARKGDRS